MSHKDPQVIDGSHVDQTKLIRLLEAVYGKDDEGKNNFHVELRLNRYKIYPKEEFTTQLTEKQIQDCIAYRRRR